MKDMSTKEADIRRRARLPDFGCDSEMHDYLYQRGVEMWDAIHTLIGIIDSARDRESLLESRVDDCRRHCTNPDCRTESLRTLIESKDL